MPNATKSWRHHGEIQKARANEDTSERQRSQQDSVLQSPDVLKKTRTSVPNAQQLQKKVELQWELCEGEWKSALNSQKAAAKSLQHGVFPSGHPAKY